MWRARSHWSDVVGKKMRLPSRSSDIRYPKLSNSISGRDRYDRASTEGYSVFLRPFPRRHIRRLRNADNCNCESHGIWAQCSSPDCSSAVVAAEVWELGDRSRHELKTGARCHGSKLGRVWLRDLPCERRRGFAPSGGWRLAPPHLRRDIYSAITQRIFHLRSV